MAFTQIGEHRKTVAIRQIQIEKNEAEISMLVHERHRLSTIRSFENYGVALRLLEHAFHRVAYQHMVVDDKKSS